MMTTRASRGSGSAMSSPPPNRVPGSDHHPTVVRIVRRACADPGSSALAQNLDGKAALRMCQIAPDIGERQRLADAMAVAARGDEPGRAILGMNDGKGRCVSLARTPRK